MSYYSYLKSMKPIDVAFLNKTIGSTMEQDRKQWGIKPDNTRIALEKNELDKGFNGFQYHLWIEEFSAFPKHRDMLLERLIDQMMQVIPHCNLKNNKIVIETVWEGRQVKHPPTSYNVSVPFSSLSRNTLKEFFMIENVDYRSIEIVFD